MFRAGREKLIQDFVNENGIVSIEEIMAVAGISKATAHRYINRMNDEQQLFKIRGGARSVKDGEIFFEEPSFNRKSLMNRDEKLRIARVAIDMIGAKDHIILDSGSTVLELAKLLKKDTETVVITNDIRIAALLGDYKRISLLMIGGMIRPEFSASYGYFAEAMMESISADKLFFSVDGISSDFKLTNYTLDDLNLKKSFIARTREKILLCDHSKFSAGASYVVESLDKVDTIIVGNELDSDTQNRLIQMGKNVILA